MNFFKDKAYILWTSVFFIILGIVYHPWFTRDYIIGGDWPFIFDGALKEFPLFVPSWNTWLGNGLGGASPFYFLQSFENFTTAFVIFLHIPWVIVYKIFWFGLFLFFSFFTSLYLLKTIFSKINFYFILLAGLTYSTNTYILMVVGGGQMGVALSYAVAPLVLARFIKLIDCREVPIRNFQLSLLAGLALSFQVVFDPRIAYLTMVGVALYFILNITKNVVKNIYLICFIFVIPIIVSLLLHATWILPIFISKQSSFSDLGSAYTGVGIVKFLSFASFSQSLSLLHPNWPENIFGKGYFMRPEFLLLPITAFSSLFFISKTKDQKTKTYVLFFALLGIVGVFLAKGANPPFGGIYLWLFENIPGFVMFRDPTKFYLLIALSYSVLVPYSLLEISNRMSGLRHKLLLVMFLAFLAISIRPAILGQLGGTFKQYEVPREYVAFKDFIYNQPEFFRTLWVPRQQRFSFVSNIHPSIEINPLFNATSAAEAIIVLKKPGTKEYLSELSVKYIIVPYDSLGEIFQKDRKYDEKEYNKTVNDLSRIEWLKFIDGFGKIKVFETPTFKKHFYLKGDGEISDKMISPVQYFVNFSVNEDQSMIFSEKYNPYWVAKLDGKIIRSQKTATDLNSFSLKKGKYDLEVIFLQEEFYNYGRIISLASLLIVIILILKLKKSPNLSN